MNNEYSLRLINLNDYKNEYQLLSKFCYPFQKLAVLKSVCKVFYALRFSSYTRHYAVLKNNTPILFASFRFFLNNETCSVVGCKECFDIVDFVYGDIDENTLKNALECVLIEVNLKGKTHVIIDWLPADSRTKKCLEQLIQDGFIECQFGEVPNYRIPFSAFPSYDDYIGSLSKSVRQNIRTAYNRLNRDAHKLKLNICFGNDNKDRFPEKGLQLYLKGQKARYNHFGISYWIHFKYIHYLSRTMNESYSFHASIMIDDNMAAMMQGYYDENRREIQIPRLAIDSEYSFYSPGYLMICETIKWLTKNTDIQALDLMRGGEKYKLDLGGQKYITYKCNVHIKNKNGS